MITQLTHRRTGDQFTVELEIGPTWWLRDERSGHIQVVQRADYSPTTWHMAGKDLPVEAQGFTTA